MLIALATLSAPRPMPFMLGVQAWTFHRYTCFEAVEKTAITGAKHIELFPGQKLKPGSEATVGPSMTMAEMTELKNQLSKHGVKATAFGVTGIDSDYAKSKSLFTWAKAMGIGILNTESDGSMDTIERLVKEFDIKVGFHNHPKQPNNPNYKVWDPAYIYSLVKDRDRRIGACADTGHWVRSGIKPVEALKTLKGRVVSSHLKDLNKFGESAHDLPFGTGVSDMLGVFAAYDKMKMVGSASVEYEHNWETNVPEVAQCIGFVNGLYAR